MAASSIDEIERRYAQPAAAAAPAAVAPSSIDEIERRYGAAPAAPAPRAGPVTENPSAGAGKPSMPESFTRSALQAATFGYGDEAAAAIDKVLGKVGLGPEIDYTERRDQYRARNRAAAEENKWSSRAGTVAGAAATMFAPGLGAARATTAGGAALRGAAAGAISGHGTTERDTLAGQLLDTAVGGVVGGVVGGTLGAVGQKIASARGRVEQREIGNLLEGLPGGPRMKVTGPKGQNVANVRAALRDAPEVARNAKDAPAVALAAAEKRLAPTTSRLDELYDVAQSASAGAPLTAVQRQLEELAKEYGETTAGKTMSTAIRGVSADIAEKYGSTNVVDGVAHVPFQALRAEYRAWQQLGYQGAYQFSIPAQKQMKRDVSDAMRGVLQHEVDRAAKANPKLGISLDELKRLNKQASTWIPIVEALEEKATRGPAGAAPIGGIISGNSLRAKAREMLQDLNEPADKAFAKLVTAARAGDQSAAATVKKIYDAAKQSATVGSATAPAKAAAALAANRGDEGAEQ